MNKLILIYFLTFSFLFSCSNSEIEEDKIEVSAIEEKVEIDNKETEKIEDNKKPNNDTLSLDTFHIGKNLFSLMKVELYLTENDSLDPILNIVTKLGDNPKNLLEIGTVYEEDFSMYKEVKNLIIFENYFSTTGNKEYFVVTQDGQLYRTEALDESFVLHTKIIDINKLIVLGKDYENDFKEIKLSRVSNK